MGDHNNVLLERNNKTENYQSISKFKNREYFSEENMKYKVLFAELKDVVYESTLEGKLLDINPSGVELFGFDSKEELLKVNIAEDLYVDPNERLKLGEKLENEGFVKNYEIKIKNKNGEEKIVLETSFMLKNDEGNVIGYSGILKDVTENKKQEKLLIKYNEELAEVNSKLKESKNKLKTLNNEKDKFFSIIAHDLKNPFNALLNLSEFLVEDLADLSIEEIKSFSKEINKSANSVYNLLINLLHWAQIKTGRMKKINEEVVLSSLVKNTITLLEGLALKKSIKLINDVNSSHIFSGDRIMIGSVLQNLISNAIKFTRRNGKVIISSKISGDKIIVSVRDTGIGISAENMSMLFRINKHITTSGTANESGTGLGLILCKELVEKNNGQIWVKSEEQLGTTFSFSLENKEI